MNEQYTAGYLDALNKFQVVKQANWSQWGGALKTLGSAGMGLLNPAGRARVMSPLGKSLVGSSLKTLATPAALVGGGYMLHKLMNPPQQQQQQMPHGYF